MSFDWLFNESSSSCDSDEDISTTKDDSDEDSQFFAPLKRGKQSLDEVHPELVACISEFMGENHAGAHTRRRNTTMYTNGRPCSAYSYPL